MLPVRSKFAVSLLVVVVPFLVVACGGGTDAPTGPTPVSEGPSDGNVVSSTPTTEPTSVGESPGDAALPTPTPTEESSVVASPAPISTDEENEAVKFAKRRFPSYWETDFSKSNVPFLEIRGGGPIRDGIPPIYDPQFETVEEADQWLLELETMIVVQVGSDVRAYSQSLLMFREVVDDVVGGKPIAVTW